MPLITIGKCFRNRTDCQSFSVIEATPDNVTEQQLDELDFVPKSFVCCGLICREKRDPPQDAYRLCFKNEVGDEMTDNDEQDLTNILAVISNALAVVAVRRMNHGHINVPTDFEGEHGMMSVNTKQGVVPA